MQIIPTQPVPSQTLQVALAGQVTQISLYQTDFGLFVDIENAAMPNGGLFGQICQNLNRIIRDTYLGYSGDFIFIDTSGSDDPVYTGLGDRFNLAYLTAAEAADA